VESLNNRNAVYWLTIAVALAPLVSIAATNILFVAALLAVLGTYRRFEMPQKLGIPLLLFILLTVLAVAVAGDWRVSYPKVKQLIVFATLPLVFTVFRRETNALRRLLLGWTMIATASAMWSFVQFFNKRQYAIEHRLDFYPYYVGQRATGFMSHWMTFGAEQMVVLLAISAALLFGVFQIRKALWVCTGIVAVSIAISFVRSVWLGTAVGAIYLFAVWRPKLLLLLPVLVLIGWIAAPRSVRQRAISVYQPHGTVDSNEHRNVTRRTGFEMIRTHPLLGIGPDVVARDFIRYVPADIARPLPEGAYGHLHNIYLQVAAERGIPALIAFLWFIAAALLQIAKSAGRFPVLHGAIAIIIAALAEGFFEVNLGDSEVLRMFLTVIACAFAVIQQEPARA
jgi:putative inorganic carbon (hco3(-)) transporter